MILGKTVCYFLNYSGMELEMPYDYKNGIELLENTAVEMAPLSKCLHGV